MKRFEKLLLAVEQLCQMVTVVLMLAIMLIVFCDVASRHLFNHPLGWAYDLIGLYLIAGVYFLSLSDSYAAHAHVGVDILVRNWPEPCRRISEMLTNVVGIALFGLICSAASMRGWQSYLDQDVVSGLIAWPTWISSALVALGCGLLVLRLVFRLAGNTLSLMRGHSVVDALPLAGAHFGE
ncbi:TRAP transporter small permease [Paraburkholderia acidicola]|uniref:TRAP transporter small permease protein n=1 Tax=Paraburkholderia acidicola TaxID=1912599 RepID=A0ABV1LY76_9BURK